MRISDCSSDVCSSDLCFKSAASAGYNETGAWPRPRLSHGRPAGATSATVAGMTFGRSFPAALRLPWGMFTHLDHSRLLRFAGLFTWAVVRSGEQKSEHPLPLRSPYAGFRLKKNKKTNH